MESLVTYIKKLNHPIKEIRERSLKLLLAKLQYGWKLQDELGSTRDLIEALLAWFDFDQPCLQREALQLLMLTIKTKGGTYVVKEFGIDYVIANLNRLMGMVNPDAIELLEDILDTLCFLNTVDSSVELDVPPLKLNSVTSSHSNNGCSSIHVSLQQHSPKEVSVPNESDVSAEQAWKDGIICFLFPWVELSSSDVKTITLIKDSLKLLKSTRRCCRFIRDVFVRDFPAQIFLNRPTIIKTLLSISEGQCGGHPDEALAVLLCITRAMHKQLLQLKCLDLVCESRKISVDQEEPDDNINIELQEAMDSQRSAPQPESLLALRQLPVPVYALDTAHAVLTILAREVVLDNFDTSSGDVDKKDIYTCVCLVESLLQLLMDSVGEQFWSAEHNRAAHRDVAQKACGLMRALGDVLARYSKCFELNPDRVQHRCAWLRLTRCAARLLRWARRSALPPTALVTALQQAQLDPALDLLHPKISKAIAEVLQTAKSSVDQEHKSKYKELLKLYDSIENAVQFKILRRSTHDFEKIISSIEKTLPMFNFNSDQSFYKELVTVLFENAKELDPNDGMWSKIRDLVLKLMSHSVEWVRVTFYLMLLEYFKSAFIGDDRKQVENEKCLNMLCHVEILTEICCQGLTSSVEEVAESSSEIMLYILRGRLVLSESCWWRLLASLLPVLPLLHAHAAHDTPLGEAICKSLEADIVSCMGVSTADRWAGLSRLLFVKCGTVQLDAAHSLCRLLDDDKYLPPKETLRADILLSAIRRVEPQYFNIDESRTSDSPQTTGLTQIMEVLKQDLILDEDGSHYRAREDLSRATLEPSMRRSTLQQLAVMMRHQEPHEAFLQHDGINLVLSLLRMSLMVDDHLAFPECAISCVSVLNSVGFASRHTLANLVDLPRLLLRVILVFPANEDSVCMSAQLLALWCWAGFALAERCPRGRRVVSLPHCVTQRVRTPFPALSYWNTSPNTEHSRIDWVLSDERCRHAVLFRWWWSGLGGAASVRAGGHAPNSAPPHLAARAIPAATASCVLATCSKGLLALENATSHQHVLEALTLLQSCIPLMRSSSTSTKDFAGLPWQHTQRFLRAPPASVRDAGLLIALLHCIITYIDTVPAQDNTMSWIKSAFIGNNATVISLLGRDKLYPQQTAQDEVELTQLRIHIVKVLVRCIVLVEQDGDFTAKRMESLVKILLASLETVDLKNFHMLGYLNELMRCLRYALHSRHCQLSEDTLVRCVHVVAGALGGCAAGAGRRGHACRLDATLAVLALVTQAQQRQVPVNRWGECFNGSLAGALVRDCGAARAQLRAAALHTVAALAHHAQLLPQVQQCLPRGSLVEFALEAFGRGGEANVVRAAAAALLTVVTARTSTHSQVTEIEVLEAVNKFEFIDECLSILVEFFDGEKDYDEVIEPNVPLSVLERQSELEVRAQKCDVHVSPTSAVRRPPPSAALVAAAIDVVHNVCHYRSADVKTWNERGLFRLIFRCASSSAPPSVRAAGGRALVAAAGLRCVRTTLAHAVDCLHLLLATLMPDKHVSVVPSDEVAARAHALLLLSTLMPERAAGDVIWTELSKEHSMSFYILLLESLDSENSELQDAAIYCLSVLTQSMLHKTHNDLSQDRSCVEFFDNLKSPMGLGIEDRGSAGDGAGYEECQPEYMAESYCKVLLKLFHEHADNNPCYSSQVDRWRRICACLCALARASGRARAYAAHRHAPRSLAGALQRLRDALSLQGKSADVIKHTNNDPILETLHWILTLMTCLMVDSRVVKDSFATEQVQASLSRLWAWGMMSETLRLDMLTMLCNFTNDCPKAWSRVCACVCGRSVVGEVCALGVREAARARRSGLLPLALRVLSHCAPHHHCRSIIIKSDVVNGAVRCSVRGGEAGAAAARLCSALARHADGAGAVLTALGAGPTAGVGPSPAARRLLHALAHAAHHHRQTYLQSAELLEVVTSALLTGDTAELVAAGRAVWALAANNHRAKLILRSSGVSSALQTGVQRLQRSADGDARRALQLLQYAHTVLQAT